MDEVEFPTRAALWAGAAFIGTIAAVIGAVTLMLWHWHLPAGGPSSGPVNALAFSGPALQTAPQPELARYQAEKKRQLASGAWLDARAGVARIPLDEAMRLMASDHAASASASASNPEATP